MRQTTVGWMDGRCLVLRVMCESSFAGQAASKSTSSCSSHFSARSQIYPLGLAIDSRDVETRESRYLPNYVVNWALARVHRSRSGFSWEFLIPRNPEESSGIFVGPGIWGFQEPRGILLSSAATPDLRPPTTQLHVQCTSRTLLHHSHILPQHFHSSERHRIELYRAV